MGLEINRFDMFNMPNMSIIQNMSTFQNMLKILISESF
jgi:hypothetical protein